jgi:hypothetical protein
MKSLLLYLLMTGGLLAPVYVLEYVRQRNRWVEERHNVLIVAWVACVFVLYVWGLPRIAILTGSR